MAGTSGRRKRGCRTQVKQPGGAQNGNALHVLEKPKPLFRVQPPCSSISRPTAALNARHRTCHLPICKPPARRTRQRQWFHVAKAANARSGEPRVALHSMSTRSRTVCACGQGLDKLKYHKRHCVNQDMDALMKAICMFCSEHGPYYTCSIYIHILAL